METSRIHESEQQQQLPMAPSLGASGELQRRNLLWILDLLLMLGCVATCILSVLFLDTGWLQYVLIAVFTIAFAACAYRLFLDRSAPTKKRQKSRLPSTICLLNEEGQTIGEWSLVGRVSLIIGKADDARLDVDVDLAASPDATFIESQHAVVNYAAGSWYIEDLYSENGLRVQKSSQGTAYRVTRNRPCRIHPGDTIYIANTRLLIV